MSLESTVNSSKNRVVEPLNTLFPFCCALCAGCVGWFCVYKTKIVFVFKI